MTTYDEYPLTMLDLDASEVLFVKGLLVEESLVDQSIGPLGRVKCERPGVIPYEDPSPLPLPC